MMAATVDEDLQELVQRSIQEVISSSLDTRALPLGQGACGLRATENKALEVDEHEGSPESPAEGTNGGEGHGIDLRLLEVPGNGEATIRLLKARVRSLEGQLADAHARLQGQSKALSDTEKQVKLLGSEKAAWSKALKAAEAQADKNRRLAAAATEALAAKELALREQAKDGVKAERDRKQVEADVRAREARLQHALEELERYKALLQDSKLQERASKDVAKSDYAKLVQEVKKLERQKSELLSGFKKQLRLIDVLKRQRIHVEAARQLALTEEEFSSVLDSGPVGAPASGQPPGRGGGLGGGIVARRGSGVGPAGGGLRGPAS